MEFLNALQTSIPRAVATAGAMSVVAFASAQQIDGKNQPSLYQSMGITQRLGEYVPKDAPLKDDDGKTIHFGDMLQGRPVVLIPIFYQCKSGCSLLVEQVIQTLAKANKGGNKLVLGRDLDLVMVSIHPKETPDIARAKKEFFMGAYEPPNAPANWRTETGKHWHLLTGNWAQIHSITDAIGLKYSYNEKKDLINHPTCTVMLTPKGQISSYTIGNEFPSKVIESNLGIAASNLVGDKADQSMMFGCIMLDPITHKYRVVIENVLRLASVLTLLIVIISIVSMSLQSKREEKQRNMNSGVGAPS